MRERLLTLGLGIGALILFYALIFPKPHTPAPAQGLPLSTDARPEGYLAIWRWLGTEHIPRVSLRYRYARLPGLLPRPTGNLLIVTLPQRVPMQATERGALRAWVARGNTLLIAAALDDEPLWAADTDDPVMIQDLERLAGLKFLPARAVSLLRSLGTRGLDLRPLGTQPLLEGVKQINAPLTLPSRAWRAHLTYGQLPLQLAVRSDDGLPALWLEHLGLGQIILCAAASPFSNAGMAHPGNARFLANIIAWSRGPGGAVVFDDAHEGLTAFYDARAFFADPRLHATLGWIVILWLIFVVGSIPLRVRQPLWQPLDESAYIEGSARYLAAVVEPGEAARRMIEDFLGELTGHAGDPGAAAWRRLETEPGVSGAERAALRAWYARAHAGRRVSLTRLQNLLAQLRKAIR